VWCCPCLDRVGLLAVYVECVYKEDYLCLKYILKFRILASMVQVHYFLEMATGTFLLYSKKLEQ
jgi:hypothetical protein